MDKCIKCGMDIGKKEKVKATAQGFICEACTIPLPPKEKCTKCGREIGYIEEACVWNDGVVCAECHAAALKELAKKAEPPVAARPMAQPSAKGNFPTHGSRPSTLLIHWGVVGVIFGLIAMGLSSLSEPLRGGDRIALLVVGFGTVAAFWVAVAGIAIKVIAQGVRESKLP